MVSDANLPHKTHLPPALNKQALLISKDILQHKKLQTFTKRIHYAERDMLR